jgi:hypothetical protein
MQDIVKLISHLHVLSQAVPSLQVHGTTLYIYLLQFQNTTFPVDQFLSL